MIYCESLDRTGEGKLFFNQVGDLIRGLGFKPTNKDVAGVLGNPKKEEMNTKTCTFDDFLGYVKGSGKSDAKCTPPQRNNFYEITTTLQSLSPKLNKKEHSKILLKVFEFSIKKEMEPLWALRRVFEEIFFRLTLVGIEFGRRTDSIDLKTLS